MTEYVSGAARAVAAVDRETERAELPSPHEVKPRTLVRTSGGRTWHRVLSEPVGAHWQEVTLVPRAELAYRRMRLLVLIAMAIAAYAWLFAIPDLPWLGAGNIGIPAFIGGVAIVIWWQLFIESSREHLMSAERIIADRPGAQVGEVGLERVSTLPEPLNSVAEILAGGVLDPYEGLPRQLPLPRATTPGTVIRINDTTWRRWGTGWSPVHRLVTGLEERWQRAFDALLCVTGGIFCLAGVLETHLGAAERNVLLLLSEACLFLGFLAAGAARHRAQLPARPNTVAVGAIRNAQLRANRQTKDQ